MQLSAARAFSVCKVGGGSHAALCQNSIGAYVQLSRDKLSRRRAKQLRVAVRSAATLSKTNQAAQTDTIPEALRKYVAHVALQGRKQPIQVYILGASHVSRQSCNHAAQLISTIKPDILLLELCKDRVDLLVDPSMPPPQHWHSRVINIHSNFAQHSSLTATACKKLLLRLRCQPGKSFAAYDIEQDCIQLLSSGMFASMAPMTKPASLSDAPMFVYNGSQVLLPPWPCFHKVSACSSFAVHTMAGQIDGGMSVIPLMLHASIALNVFAETTLKPAITHFLMQADCVPIDAVTGL